MPEWAVLLVLLIGYLVFAQWVLPKFGIPT